MRRLAAALAVSLLVISACGGTSDEPPRPRNVPLREVELPELRPATPAFALATDGRFETADIDEVRGMKGVSVVAPASLRELKVRVGKKSATVTVGSIDPLLFRRIAPAPTRDAEFVWTSLLAGEAVVTFDGAKKLGIEGNEEIAAGGNKEFSVGALADNGIPNFADVLLDEAHGRQLNLTQDRLLLVGADPDASIGEIGDALAAAFPNAQVRRLLPSELISPGDPQATGAAYGGVIGYMRFKTLPNGFIEPDPTWIATNIATGEVPLIGTVTCHRLIFPQLHAALAEIESEGLGDQINPADYGGCYVPRFISRDPTRALSMHAFGLALDINVSQNQLGTEGNMHPDVVAAFEKWGFEWGGRWDNPKDPMHFEVVRLIAP
jgi:D-alanyl-D-alanine carboxypeptidase